MEMTFFPFLFYAIKSHFHKKGFALGLFLKVADFGSRKLLITSQTQKLCLGYFKICIKKLTKVVVRRKSKGT